MLRLIKIKQNKTKLKKMWIAIAATLGLVIGFIIGSVRMYLRIVKNLFE